MTKRSYPPATMRRTLIVQAASRPISRDGLNGLTMVAVAKEAGVSRQLVYDHFPDLPTLFQAAFAEQARQYERGLDDVFASVSRCHHDGASSSSSTCLPWDLTPCASFVR